jgi:hypothetical protein
MRSTRAVNGHMAGLFYESRDIVPSEHLRLGIKYNGPT